MKKTAYKGPKGSTFRSYYHGNRKTNGCTFRMGGKGQARNYLLARDGEEYAPELERGQRHEADPV